MVQAGLVTDKRGSGLIGVEDIRTPYWVQLQQSVASAGAIRIASAALRTTALVTKRAWAASRGLTALAGVLHLVSGAVTAAGLFATANVFTALLQQGPSVQRVIAAAPALGVVAATYAARGLLDAAISAVQATLAPRVEQLARDRLYAVVLEVDLASFDDADFVELLGKASHDSLTQLKSVTAEILDLLRSLVSVSAAVVVAGFFHPLLAPTVVLAAVPQGWAAIRSAQISYDSFVRMTSRNRRLGVTSDLITGRRSAAEVRAFTAKGMLLAEHRHLATQVAAEARSVEFHKAQVRLAGRGLAGTGTAIAYAVLGILLYAGMLPLALAGAAAVALRSASSAVTTSVYTANRVYEASLYIDMYLACLRDAQRRTRTVPATVPMSERSPQRIELCDVSFTYPGASRPALTNVSVTLRAGEVLALVGENGSGKSTLAKLATGLYLPTSGTVRWDGIDIATINPDTLFDRVAVIMQSPLEWPMTAANNIRIGRINHPEPNMERVRSAASRSGADTLIERLPQGYDTVLSTRFQNGTDLSGGQWQRIGIARGIYRDANFLIADEPSAALDARAEHEVFRTLRQVILDDSRAERVTLLITHRLANIRYADQIVVLSHGCVTESGTHSELMRQEGRYHQLFTLQASEYFDGLGKNSPPEPTKNRSSS